MSSSLTRAVGRVGRGRRNLLGEVRHADILAIPRARGDRSPPTESSIGRAASGSAASVVSDVTGQPSRGGLRRVLIVDDQPAFRQAARRLLEARGYDVVGEAGCGASALEAVERHAPQGRAARRAPRPRRRLRGVQRADARPPRARRPARLRHRLRALERTARARRRVRVRPQVLPAHRPISSSSGRAAEPRLSRAPRSGSRCARSTCRSPRPGARPGGSAGSSSGRTGASRP